MPALDIFNNDAFGVSSLTRAINDEPHQPTRLGEMGLFEESGISTTTLMVERQGSTIALVPAAARGSVGKGTGNDKRKLIPISTVHLPQYDAVLADEVQNVRAFGSETELQMVQSIVNRKLGKLRRNIDTTMEWQRLGALKGQVLDADGTTVLMDMFQTFNLTPTTHALVLNNTATKVQIKVIEAIRKIEAALGGLMYREIRVICGEEFFDQLVGHESVQKAYERWAEGAFLRDDHRSQAGGGGFPFAKVMFEEYRGKVGNTDFVDPSKAYMFPVGVKDMFVANFAPADYMETVNTIGVPYYAKQEAMPMNKGVNIEAQSNPIHYNARPNAVCELTIS